MVRFRPTLAILDCAHRDHCAVLDIIPEADVIRHVLMGGARSDN
jgi:hypothetical protein